MRSEELREQIEPLISGRGFTLVEVSAESRRGWHVTVVLHRAQGVSLADCEGVAWLIRRHPSLGPLLNDADLEVCSPGVGRKIRDDREYSIFRGRGIRILRKGGSGEWIRGRIEQAEDGCVTVVGNEARVEVPMREIKRAFLDDTQEVVS